MAFPTENAGRERCRSRSGDTDPDPGAGVPASLVAEAKRDAASLGSAAREGDAHAQAIHQALQGLGGILTADEQLMHAQGAEQQQAVEREYKTLGTTVEGLIAKVADIKAQLRTDLDGTRKTKAKTQKVPAQAAQLGADLHIGHLAVWPSSRVV